MLEAPLQRRTQVHYQEHPFDFLTEEDESRIDDLQPPPFRRFVDVFVPRDGCVAEIGCGPGRGTMYLSSVGLQLLAVDLSDASLRLARRRAPNVVYVQASNLDLPLRSAAFDAVVSDGVIHHTPDARRSFDENCRILKSGGVLYVGVYRRYRYYYYIYNWFGPVVRWLDGHAWGHALISCTLLPLYYLVHLIKSRGRRTWRGAVNFFYDYIITPQATFHTYEEIVRWGAANELVLLEYHKNVGNVHAFIFRKG